MNGVAVNRIKAFAQYLGDEFHVDVFTLGESDREVTYESGSVFYLASDSVLKHLKHNSSDSRLTHHSKTALNVLTKKLDISALKNWKKKVFQKLSQVHGAVPYDVLISSYAPVEAHAVAYDMKRRYPELIWIADMRDEMSRNPFLSGHERAKLAQREKAYNGYIDAVTSVSAPILNDFRSIFSQVHFFEEIRNGFDHDQPPIYPSNEKFKMVFAGTFYGKLKPDLFLTILSRLVEEGNIERDFEIYFVGSNKNFVIPKNLQSHIQFIPKVPYDEAIGYMKTADCNLLFCPPFDTKGRYTGKLFDYLSVERPILALIDKEDVGAELIREHDGGEVADFYNEAEIESAFKKIYNNWKNNIVFNPKRELTSKLHRKHQVEKLKALIHRITAK